MCNVLLILIGNVRSAKFGREILKKILLFACYRGEATEEESLEEIARAANPEEISIDEDDDEDEDEKVEGAIEVMVLKFVNVVIMHIQAYLVFYHNRDLKIVVYGKLLTSRTSFVIKSKS